MPDEVGVEADLAFSAGLDAEAMANAMAGLSDTFESLVDEASSNAHHPGIKSGFTTFMNSYGESISKVEENGLTIADNIQEGVRDIAENDAQNSDDYGAAWPGVGEINFE